MSELLLIKVVKKEKIKRKVNKEKRERQRKKMLSHYILKQIYEIIITVLVQLLSDYMIL